MTHCGAPTSAFLYTNQVGEVNGDGVRVRHCSFLILGGGPACLQESVLVGLRIQEPNRHVLMSLKGGFSKDCLSVKSRGRLVLMHLGVLPWLGFL